MFFCEESVLLGTEPIFFHEDYSLRVGKFEAKFFLGGPWRYLYHDLRGMTCFAMAPFFQHPKAKCL